MPEFDSRARARRTAVAAPEVVPTPFDGRRPLGVEQLLALQRSAGNRSVAAAALQRQAKALGSLDPSARQAIQVATAAIEAGKLELEEDFGPSAGSTALPPGAKAVYGAGVPKQLERGLSSVAAEIWHITYKAAAKNVAETGFRLNTTVQVAIDLTPYGGPDAVWRFTYYALPKGSEILIELLGPNTRAAGQAQPREQRLTAHGFTVAGFSPAEREAVLEAVSLVPDTALARLRGLSFTRTNSAPAGSGDEGAWYDVNTHSIAVLNKAFGATQVRHRSGAGFSAAAVRTIVHELGHAVDMDRFRAARKAGKGAVPGESGMAFGQPAGTAPAKSAFADAVAKDGGKAVTQYGATNVGEHYAEAFSLYVADPELLKALRPNVHRYFEAEFAAKPPVPPTPAGAGSGSGAAGRALARQPRDAPPDPKTVTRAFGKRLATDRSGVLADLGKLDPNDRQALLALAPKVLPAAQAELLRRCIAFIENRPPAEKDKTFVTVGKDPGKLQLEDKLGQDTIELRTGMAYGFAHNIDRDSTFSVTYRGQGAGEARLLQFIWREVVGHLPPKSPGGPARKAAASGSSGKGYDFTTNDKKPNWGTDGTPWREHGTAVNRSASELAVFDSPDARSDQAARLFDDKADPATKVVSHAHITTYMVRGMDIVQAAELDLYWEFPGPGLPPKVLPPVAKRRANKLEPAQRAVLVKQFPAERLEYLP